MSIETPLLGGDFFAKANQVVRGRWFTIFAAIMVMSFSGSTFIFGAYSDDIKTALDYDQTTINLISAYKNAGSNIGIVAGLIAEVVPTWLVLLIGAVANLLGYGFQWLAVNGLVKPKVWQMCASTFIGANSETFFTTGALVTCVKNFPDRRGLVLGILKAYGAISGAVLEQFHSAFYSGDDDGKNMLLTIAWLPLAVALVFLFIFRQLEKEKQIKETRIFYQFLYVSIVFALFLLTVTVVQFEFQFSRAAHIARAAAILLLLLSSLYVAIRAELKKQVLEIKTKQVSAAGTSYRAFTWKSVHGKNDRNRSKLSSCFGNVFDKPRRGEDYTILQALLSADMLILTGSVMFGMGAIFAAIDNMGQIGDALGYQSKSIDSIVTLMNIWNFFGRVFAGFASESLLINYRVSRPMSLCLFIVLSCVGHLLIAFPAPGSVPLASVVLGFSMGAMVPLVCTIVSEIFGLKYYFTLYNCGQLASPLGAYLLNVFVIGRIYDREANYKAENRVWGYDSCGGKVCFRTSFLVVAGAAFCGALLSFVLAMRTDEFYRVDIVRIYKGEFYQEFEDKSTGREVDHAEKGQNFAEQRVQLEEDHDDDDHYRKETEKTATTGR